jgi:hypothetical protein
MWGAFSDEMASLLFTIAAGLRKRTHSWVRNPRNSRSYFPVSDTRLSEPGGPGPGRFTTRRVTVEVLELLPPPQCEIQGLNLSIISKFKQNP